MEQLPFAEDDGQQYFVDMQTVDSPHTNTKDQTPRTENYIQLSLDYASIEPSLPGVQLEPVTDHLLPAVSKQEAIERALATEMFVPSSRRQKT